MRIKANRIAANLSCREAAEVIGKCNIRTWKRWEAADRMPDKKFMDLLLYVILCKAMRADFEKKRGV
jgi:hypothetical protein